MLLALARAWLNFVSYFPHSGYARAGIQKESMTPLPALTFSPCLRWLSAFFANGL
jgi:hypothetical protein